MTLRDTIVEIGSRYEGAARQPMAGHDVASLVRSGLMQEIQRALGSANSDLTVKASPGNGNWAAVPWAAVFDGSVTISATRGYYPVYLFDVQRQRLFLSLNQGTTTVREEFGARTPAVLATRASLMRQRVSDYERDLPTKEIELGDGRLGSDYASGHAMGIEYRLGALPDDATLLKHLSTVVACYRALTFRGGLDFDTDANATDADAEVEEQRRYRMHQRIERNPKAARLARQHHGFTCQCCAMSFASRYGPIGDAFIEVHHLKPISSLKEGERVSYNIASDFAVLCSNCHRMIHRMQDPSDLAGLRKLMSVGV